MRLRESYTIIFFDKTLKYVYTGCTKTNFCVAVLGIVKTTILAIRVTDNRTNSATRFIVWRII